MERQSINLVASCSNVCRKSGEPKCRVCNLYCANGGTLSDCCYFTKPYEAIDNHKTIPCQVLNGKV